MTASSRLIGAVAAHALLWCAVASGVLIAEEPVLRLRAPAVGAQAGLTIELFRWSSDAERDMVTSARSAPAAPSAPPVASAPAPPAGGRGRGGRGGAAPLSAIAKLTAAVKAAPTLGFIWGEGPTGYSIKYAWRTTPVDGHERIVFVTDRRLGAHVLPAAVASTGSTDMDFTVIEARTDGKGAARLEVTR